MRDYDRRSAFSSRLRVIVMSGTFVALAACGARSSTIADDEPIDCAAERQRVFEECQKKCGGAQSPMRHAGRTSGPLNEVGLEATEATPCIDECVAAAQRECERTATCRCADSLLTVSER